MQKIVVNKCYGGFGLSLKAQKEYLKSIGKEAYFYIQSKYRHRDGGEEHKRIDVDSDNRSLFAHAFTKDFGETYEKLTDDEYREFNFYDRDIERDDPKLVEIVERLGEEASGNCAELSITEIPDGVKWVIDDYDGMESVSEAHQTW